MTTSPQGGGMTTSASDREAHLWQNTKDVLAQLAPNLVLAVYRSAVLHWFNLEILRRLEGGELPRDLPGDTSAEDGFTIDELYTTLVDLPFVEVYGRRFSAEPQGGSSFALHDLTRKIVLEHLWAFEQDFVRSFSNEAAKLFLALQTSDKANAFVYVLERLHHLLLVDEQAALSELRDRIAQAGRKGEFGQLHALARIPAEHASAGRLSSPATQWADVLLAYSLAVAGENEGAPEILQGVRDRGEGRLSGLGSARIEATLILATVSEDTGQYAEARDLYEEVIDDLSAEGTVEGRTEDTNEAKIGALAGAARAYLAQDLLREAADLYGKCLNLYASMSRGEQHLFVGSILERAVAVIRRIRAADFPVVADGHEPDHWQLDNGLLYVQVSPESGNLRYAGSVYREVRPSAVLVDLWTQVGQLYASMGAYGEAKRVARLARAASEALDNPWAKAEVGMLLVRLGSPTGDADLRNTGIQFLLRALEVARSEEDRWLELTAQLGLGDARLSSDENDSAAKCFSEALELARALGSLRNESDALVGLGHVASRAGRDEARPLFKQAIELLLKLKNSRAAADIQLELAKLEIDAERWEAAEQLLRQALVEYRREKRPSGESRALSLMGELAKGRGNIVEARSCLQEAVALGAEASIPSIQITGQTGLARIHLILQRPDEARALYDQALTLAKDADLKARQAEVLMGQGWVDYETDILEGAKEKFARAFEVYSEANDLGGQAEARIGQANVERRLGHADSALQLNAEAVGLAERSGKKSLRVAAERAYGITLGEAGKAEEALKMFQRQPLKESPEDAGILGGLSWSLYILGRYEESIEASSAGYSRDSSQLWILRNKGLAYLASGDPTKAKQAYQEALRKTSLGDPLGEAIRDVQRLLDRRPDTQGGLEVLAMLRQWRPSEEEPD